MVSGVLAWFGKISWWWLVGVVIGIVLVFGAPQIVAWVRDHVRCLRRSSCAATATRASTADTLFVGLTRPAMLFGVTYSAMLINVVLTMETFIVTKNLLWLASLHADPRPVLPGVPVRAALLRPVAAVGQDTAALR